MTLRSTGTMAAMATAAAAALVLPQAALCGGTAQAAATGPAPAPALGDPVVVNAFVEVDPHGVVSFTAGTGRDDTVRVSDRTSRGFGPPGTVTIRTSGSGFVRTGPGCIPLGPFITCYNPDRRLQGIRIDTRDGDDTVVVDRTGASASDSSLHWITVAGGTGSDRITNDTALQGSLYGDAGDDVVQGGRGPDVIIGSAGDDTLRGGTGDDTLLGGSGRDTLLGEGGRDHLHGGAGEGNVLDGGPDTDSCDFANPGGSRANCEDGSDD
ncbi:hypothetical protein OG871_03660 [Kitasatospora sp. NBC_00374]|uniref:calcium-binding protein n=1 Tax=Kitasatospora sp. NBC_00374 TaxID=2975964 RepID=UPI0030E50CA3